MAKDLFVVDLKKAQPLWKEEGLLTRHGTAILEDYARAWVTRNTRDLAAERQYPELVGLFYDIRSDAGLARTYATKG